MPVGNPFDPNSQAFQTLVGSLYGPLSYQSRFANSVLDLTHGHPPFDNSTTNYSIGPSPLLPASVLQPAVTFANAAVRRYTMDAAANNFLEHSFTPTGELQFPVITLHTMWDPGVPAFHETAFHHKVQAAGATQFLLQRFYPAYGHCTIPPAVYLQNFLDLVSWVTSGNKPAN